MIGYKFLVCMFHAQVITNLDTVFFDLLQSGVIPSLTCFVQGRIR